MAGREARPHTASQYRARMPTALRGKPRGEIELERGLLTAVALFRWIALLWMLALVAWQGFYHGHLEQPVAALLAAGAAAVYTVWATLVVRRRPDRLLGLPAIATEVVIAVNLGLADGYAYDGSQVQSFGSAWPLACVLTAGIAFGGTTGLWVGALVGLAGFGGELLKSGLRDTELSIGVVSSGVLYALAGGTAGVATAKLREAERELAVAQAREEVARALHDGVLQTLAVVQRRAPDDDLVQLARSQERELREFLFGTSPERVLQPNTDREMDLGAALRDTASRAEQIHGLPVQVVLVDATMSVPPEVIDAVTGAVGEALTNAAKHARASSVTVFAEVAEDGSLFCSVKDDGAGFDPDRTVPGVGVTRSIRGRIESVGGRVEIDGRPGRGAEVRLWVP